jgi:hypothetical protein
MRKHIATFLAAALLGATAFGQVVTDSTRTGFGGGGGGSGTVTSVSVTTSNGVSGTVANPTTTPAIALTLGAITPSTVTTGTVTATVMAGTPTYTLTNGTGLPVGTGLSGLGSGIATALGVNTGSAGAPVINGGALGTPSSGTATNLTGTAASLTAGSATVLATPRAIAGHNFDGSAAITIACGDLSNGATGCSTATGTGGATIPLLNGANTWSGVQSINSGDLALKGATSGTITLNAAATAGSTTITLPGGTTDFSATGGTSQVVKQTSSGGAFTVGRLACADLSDSGGGCSSAAGATLGANTFTRLQTITQGTANEGVVASTGYSLTGSNATNMLDLAGTLNTSGNPVGLKIAFTNTASGATTKFASFLAGASGTTEVFSVDKAGALASASSIYSTVNTTAAMVGVAVSGQPTVGIGRNGSVGGLDLYGDTTAIVNISASKGNLVSTGLWGWSSGAITASMDTGTSRDAAGVVQFNGGTAATTKGAFKVIADTTGSFYRSTSSTEQTTLGTGATTTATSGNLAVANSQIKAILLRVTTTITTAANFTVKVTGGNAFCQIGTATTSNSTLTAGTTYVMVPCAHADAYVSSATTLTYTLNANPGAGVIRATVVYEDFGAPTS